MKEETHYSYWKAKWGQFRRHPLGLFALIIVALFCLMGVYAPFLASSKPIVVYFDGQWYFPLFRYLFYPRFFTKHIDLFYNLLMFTLPIFILACWLIKSAQLKKIAAIIIIACQFAGFFYLILRTAYDPAADAAFNQQRQQRVQESIKAKNQSPLFTSPPLPDWFEELNHFTPYAKLNLILRYQQMKNQHERLLPYAESYAEDAKRRGEDLAIPTLWQMNQNHEQTELNHQKETITSNQTSYSEAKAMMKHVHQYCKKEGLPPWMQCDFLTQLSPKDRTLLTQAQQISEVYEMANARLHYIEDERQWLEEHSQDLRYQIMPLLRPIHWEEDAGGDQDLNRHISWWELTRINRKDMVAALIFGTRISLSVGLTAVSLALLIGIPIGALAGFYGGKVDIIIYRAIEVWESMPTFFILLMVVAFFQNKSIFLVVGIIGLFGWTGFSRFVRGEFFRQKQLPYVEACRALSFSDRYIMFSHLLPNAIPPLLTLVPFAIMGAITTEAGLSFLGLGEEGSSSWGVLMDEGRTAFPAESYLLWPPAILLTILLVCIALVGDALRDALDPKLHLA